MYLLLRTTATVLYRELNNNKKRKDVKCQCISSKKTHHQDISENRRTL